jgi:hypothetical protein
MTKQLVDDEFGLTMDEWISSFPEELSRDAVGLHLIVVPGRDDFHLVGSELEDFVRRGIFALLQAGAIPVRFGGGSGFDWVAQKQYGIEKNQIIEAILNEWLALPDDPVVLFSKGVWFARPNPDRPRFVKLD